MPHRARKNKVEKSEMLEAHAQELAGKDQQIIAIQQLHAAEMEKLKSELRVMAKLLSSVRKTTNEVSTMFYLNAQRVSPLTLSSVLFTGR